MAKLRATLERLPAPLKGAVTGGLCFVIAAGYYLIFQLDIEDQIDAGLSRRQTLHTQLDEARALEKAYRKDLAELAEREARQKELSRILPDKTEYPAFLSAVQSAANVSGVSLSAWTPGKTVPEEFYARVPMKVELSGRFHQIARFFYNVGQLDRIINMEDIAMTQPVEKGDEVILTTSALATAFHVLDPSESGGKAQGRRRSRRRRGN